MKTEDKAKLKPIGFILRKPDKARRTFQLQPYARSNDKKVYGPPVVHEGLDALNERYLAGEITLDEAVVHLKNTLIPILKQKSKIPERLEANAIISEQNMKVFRDLWSSEYRRKRMEDPDTAKNDFMRALRTIEPLSLVTSDIDTIQNLWDKKLSGRRHKRYGHRINQLLRFLNRGVRLNLDRSDKQPPVWVSYHELKLILAQVEDPVLRDLYEFLWGTGCRLGEAFPLSEEDLKSNDTIYIHRQVTKKLVHKSYTKNRNSHHTMVLPEAKEAVLRWLTVKNKLDFRNYHRPLWRASRKVFPNNPKKHISPHKLRHSFVRYLTERGISLDKVKDLIGDSLSTTEQVYAGWVVANSEIDHMRDLIQAANSRINKRRGG